jgi:2,4-dienoyl-CoA reductase-like NADH-dependent reductase (Old Yellow Enzyme family)/pyruvate/2-oxoglutarate dehydrogenase complex dihydrolipoamide dehydrogenase (E3) component
MMTESYKHLLSAIDVGPFTLRNRVLITAHVPGIETGGHVNDGYIAYQVAKARGGAGLQISGSTAVHRTGAVGAGRGLNASDDGCLEGYKRLAEAIHQQDGRFLVQLGHAGANVADTDAGRPLLAPSPIMSRLSRETPKQLTISEIDELVEAHGTAAARVRQGGLDGVELLSAFGYLPAAFLSPYSNTRTDDYGGPVENRMRFLLRTIAAIRDSLGPNHIFGVRLPGDERVAGGLTQSDLQDIAALIAQTGQVDYLNIIVGTNYERAGRMDHWPPTPAPHGLFVPLAAGIKSRVALPVFTTGRITDPEMANAIIERGDADMVGMTRAQISDPDLVQKLVEGRPQDIRPCVGANLCIAQAMASKPIRCIHNPLTGREAAWGDAVRTDTPKTVAVIGGGPAGLEAARVAAERGHHVTLYEANDDIGGQFALWAQAPMTREFRKTLTWYRTQLTQLQVRIRTGKRLTPDDVASLEADALILATGARAAAPIAKGTGAGSIPVVDPWQVIADNPAGQHILINDEGGGRAALSAADALLDRNRITLVTAEYAIGELVTPTVRAPIYKRFLAGGAVMLPSQEIHAINGRAVILRSVHTGDETRIEDVDLVVDWRGGVVEAGLQASVEASGLPYHIVGDCVAPRQVHIAIAEGAMAARAI